MASVGLHPIMYVADQRAERAFYEHFGFTCTYEGAEFPGFFAMRRGDATFGLQAASDANAAYVEGLRWQFELTTAHELDQVVEVCIAHALDHQVDIETGGERFRTRVVRVRSPNGVTVWFEGPNEL